MRPAAEVPVTYVVLFGLLPTMAVLVFEVHWVFCVAGLGLAFCLILLHNRRIYRRSRLRD